MYHWNNWLHNPERNLEIIFDSLYIQKHRILEYYYMVIERAQEKLKREMGDIKKIGELANIDTGR